MSDGDGHSVGFLGRAHPLVRRALDRVRNLSFGGTAQRGQDPRASAVLADVPEPELLFTFVGRVTSRAGRELERVLAVRLTADGGSQFYGSADGWLASADPSKAIRTTDLWEKHFGRWPDDASRRAASAAAEGFQPLAEAFVKDRRKTLDAERLNQSDWLKKRAEEITGTGVRSAAVQRELFTEPGTDQPAMAAPPWQSVAEPDLRLAAFHADRSQPPSARVEADGVLRIYRQRLDHLDAFAELRAPEIIPLGVLMLIPEAQHGV
jgi:hypothetical protein